MLMGHSDPFEKAHTVLSSLSRSKSGCHGEGEQVARIIIPTVWVVGNAPAEMPGQLYRSWQSAQGSLREPQDGRTGAPLHPNSPIPPQHPCQLFGLTGEESKGEAGAEVPVHALEQQEAA